MDDRKDLLGRARRAYEIGRLRMAMRVLAVLVPISVVCVALDREVLTGYGLPILLGLALIGLRWHSRQGLLIANVGLTAGLLPMMAGLVQSHAGMMSTSPMVCLAICGTSGLLAGSWAGYALGNTRPGPTHFLIVSLVALGTAFLGCTSLGVDVLVALAIALPASCLITGLLKSRQVRNPG